MAPSAIAARVGELQIGGGAPVVVQSMTNTDTADAAATARQCLELAAAGSEMVRFTVNTPQAARAVPEIRRRLADAGCTVPLIGDFHYNGHLLLTAHPECARSLDKYRINPGNVGRDDSFATICGVARDLGKAVRIGVNGGSLDQTLLTGMLEEARDRNLDKTPHEVLDECMVVSALQSAETAVTHGLGAEQIVLSCKVSEPRRLIAVYRELAGRTALPLHLGLTEAGMGSKGLIWSSAAMAVLLAEGIGDTIRVSLTPPPGGARSEEVIAACELLQALDLRSFHPTVTACPGCGRTSSSLHQELAQRVEEHVRERLPQWRDRYPGVEELSIAVMGCVVNGPGESRSADIGISLPGSGEEPRAPVYADGRHTTTLQGDAAQLARDFLAIIDDYVARRFVG